MNPIEPEEAPIGALGPDGFRINLRFAGFVIVLLPLLIGLGFWQLHRADEKARALAAIAAQRATPPMSIGNFLPTDGAALDGRQVELRGHFVPDRSYLLDNRVLRGRVGYELLGLFLDDSGVRVLTDRGWLQAPPTRDRLPAFETPAGDQILVGEFYVPVDRRLLPPYPTARWPRVVQALDVPELGRLAEAGAVFPQLVVLDAGQPGVSDSDHARVNMPPGRHVAYAVQWFLMAAALFAVFLLGGTNAREWWRQRRIQGRGIDDSTR